MASKTWEKFHRRGDVLRAVMDEANRRRDGALPTTLPGVAETFGDDLALVAALQLRWHTRLAGQVERALSEQPSDLESAVLNAWRDTARELEGVRMVLDAHEAHPTDERMAEVLRAAHRKDWLMLAAMAGKAGVHDPGAARAGRALEERARAVHRPKHLAA
jgi:hypothetical protein